MNFEQTSAFGVQYSTLKKSNPKVVSHNLMQERVVPLLLYILLQRL